MASVIKKGVASAAESEVGACFQNAQSGAHIRVTLTELGHTQPATPLRTDNSTAFGILNEIIKQKRSKAMDMRYHWLTDRVRQKQFDVYWRPGRDNLLTDAKEIPLMILSSKHLASLSKTIPFVRFWIRICIVISLLSIGEMQVWCERPYWWSPPPLCGFGPVLSHFSQTPHVILD
jgi:hypothetical protein